MGYRDALDRAKSKLPQPVLQPFVLDDELFHVDIQRLPGLQWAAITADCPPRSEVDRGIGFDTAKAALLACETSSTLHDGDQKPISLERDEDGSVLPVDWRGIFDTIAEIERDRIIATWWAMNSRDPNLRVSAIKKARAGGSVTN